MNPEVGSSDSTPLSEVERIVGGAAIPATKEELALVVEAPLLAACSEFYDRNIRTINSSANRVDVDRGFAYINIDCNTLSDTNRLIAEAIGIETFTATQADGSILEVGGLKFPVTAATSVEELSDTALEVAQLFKEQPMLWAPIYQLATVLEDNPGLDEAAIIDELVNNGYFFDTDEKLFYLSEEHFRKTKGLPLQT